MILFYLYGVVFSLTSFYASVRHLFFSKEKDEEEIRDAQSEVVKLAQASPEQQRGFIKFAIKYLVKDIALYNLAWMIAGFFTDNWLLFLDLYFISYGSLFITGKMPLRYAKYGHFIFCIMEAVLSMYIVYVSL